MLSASGGRSLRMRVLIVLCLAGMALAVTACGSSSSSTTSSSAASPATPSSSGSSSSSSGSAGLKEAQAIVAKYSQTPTALTISAPITKPIPTGKTVDFIDCGIPTCTAVGNGFTQAAEKLGWTVKVIPGSTEPAAAQVAFETAIQNHPDAVAYTGVARAEINQQLTQLGKLKIPVSVCCTTDPKGNGITNVYLSAPASVQGGNVSAAYIVANSGGKANTLYVDLPDFPIYVPWRKSFAASYKKFCPTCQLATLPLPITSIGKNAPELIANYLDAHRSINYVYVVNDDAGLGLPAAMRAAGVTGVKYVGANATSANFSAVTSGQELAIIPASTAEFGWYQADILARYFAGVPQVNESQTDVQIWTAKDIPKDAASSGGAVVVDPGYQTQFLKLWGKS
jgi:ribose transport system substrate-binding protein